ncbi:addiction module protein [Bradyrhizobium sp. USDA 4369]
MDLAALTPQERFDLLTDLWDSLAAEGVVLPPTQEAELAQRHARDLARRSARHRRREAPLRG